MGRPPKFSDEQKEFIYETSEGKMTIINKVSSRNIALNFKNKFNETISKSSVNNFLLKKFGKPYRAVNSILLTEEHINQRLEFANEIIKNEIKSNDIIFTDECRIVLFPKANPKINVIRLNENDRKNIHTYEVNKKKSFFRPKFETSLIIAGRITKYGLSNLVFCSGTMNKFSYKQFLVFLKQDIEEIKSKFNLKQDLLFQQDNASCHKSRESLEAIEIIFGKNQIWWPANSPDLSPIEVVWSILKQELSKRNNTNLDELRNNVIDIWARFPQELCENIIGEFDEKIRICQKEEGKILNKALVKQYKIKEGKTLNKKEIKASDYVWESLKREKCFRIVYNDKIIGLIKKKTISKIKIIAKNKIRKYKNDHPIGKIKTGYKGSRYKEYKKKRKLNIIEIQANYDILISYIEKTSPLDFINEFLKQNLLKDKKQLINTNFSKKIEINEKILKKIMLGIEKKAKELSLDEEIDQRINTIIKRAKMSEIKDYLPNKINIDPFPTEKKIKMKKMKIYL